MMNSLGHRFQVTSGPWCVLLLLALVITIGPARLKGQGEGERSVRVWVDTIDLNVCEERGFDSWGVWLESFSDVDTAIGFRFEDTVLVCSLTLRWDTSKVRLQPPYILTPPQTLFGRFARKTQQVDTSKGELWVEASADERLRAAVGTGIPLFYLNGYVNSTDTVAPLDGGAKVQFLELQGALGEHLRTLEFSPGFVQVIRDTTPEYTGELRVMPGELDTNRFDTISVIADNIPGKRVTELRFALKADSALFRFVDTLERDTWAGTIDWLKKEVDLSDDSIYVRFAAGRPIDLDTGSVLRVVIERLSDKAFHSKVVASQFGINVASCLGKLVAFDGEITADSIPKNDTSSGIVDRRQRVFDEGVRVVAVDNRTLKVFREEPAFAVAILYDLQGRSMKQWQMKGGEEVTSLQLPETPDGTYFLAISTGDGQFVYKQLVIQTN